VVVRDRNGLFVLEALPHEAEHIVRCVNLHEELVEANEKQAEQVWALKKLRDELVEALERIDTIMRADASLDGHREVLDILRAVLAKANEE
jgi:arginine deiminase